MPTISREPATVTFDQLDTNDGELLPQRTVLSGGNPLLGSLPVVGSPPPVVGSLPVG